MDIPLYAYAAAALLAGAGLRAIALRMHGRLRDEALRVISPKLRKTGDSRRDMARRLADLHRKGLNLDSGGPEKITLLIRTIQRGDRDAFEALLDAGASPKTAPNRQTIEIGGDEWPEFHLALILFKTDPRMQPIIETLLQRSPAAADTDYALRAMTRAAYFARDENPELAAALRQLGADPDADER